MTMHPKAFSFDIGSTFTKGALVDLSPGRPRLLWRDTVPTTVERLSDGIEQLMDRCGGATDAPVYACSSAKGGLGIAALGIVPELTLHAARLAAASAGGKIIAHYSYCLTREQAAELERMQPDIVLFCGGTDGGNEQYNLRNARMLADSSIRSTILYAGNVAIRESVARILADKDLAFTDNLLPEIGRLQIEPVRACVQEIFLRRIVEGKGLSEIRSRCAAELQPTPRAVFHLIDVLRNADPAWNDSVWLDMGGATTDCYSCTESFYGEESFVLRGLREPVLKRTVEGDLGMRVSAASVLETASDYLERELARRNVPMGRMAEYVTQFTENRDYLPTDAEEQWFDALLAGACLYHAVLRHAGTIEESYTVDGKIYVQRGKDLRKVRTCIGTGGYLSRLRSDELYRGALAALRQDTHGLRLLPRAEKFYHDADYLLPLLGNLAADYPNEAAQLAMTHLRPMNPSPGPHITRSTQHA